MISSTSALAIMAIVIASICSWATMISSTSALAIMAIVIASICSLQFMDTMTKTLHITHYTHEIRGGPDNSIIPVVGETLQPDLPMQVRFGSILVFDSMIKAGADPDSQLLGRVSGTAVGALKPTSTPDNNTRVQMVMQHIFGEASKYNGSFINAVGIFVHSPPWEMVVPGATGLLRGYSGYGLCQPISRTPGPPPTSLVYKWDFYLTKKK